VSTETGARTSFSLPGHSVATFTAAVRGALDAVGVAVEVARLHRSRRPTLFRCVTRRSPPALPDRHRVSSPADRSSGRPPGEH
jgi:hypothetical protein